MFDKLRWGYLKYIRPPEGGLMALTAKRGIAPLREMVETKRRIPTFIQRNPLTSF